MEIIIQGVWCILNTVDLMMALLISMLLIERQFLYVDQQTEEPIQVAHYAT